MSSHLLIDKGKPSIAQGEALMTNEIIDPQSPEFNTVAAGAISDSMEKELLNPTPEKPLTQQLQALKEAHTKARKELESELVALLLNPERAEAVSILGRIEDLLKKHRSQYLDQPDKLQKQTAAIEFLDKLQLLLTRYEALQKEQRDDLAANLTRLYQEQSGMNIHEFMDEVKAAGLLQ